MKFNRITFGIALCLFIQPVLLKAQHTDYKNISPTKAIENQHLTSVWAAKPETNEAAKKTSNVSKNVQENATISFDFSTMKMPNKIVPLSNSVYDLLEYFEAKGCLGILPQAKPYTKITIAKILVELSTKEKLTTKETSLIQRYLDDITTDTNGLKIYSQTSKNAHTVAGFSAETSVRNGFGDKGTWTTSLIGEPFLMGDLGKQITYTAGMGLSVERLAPDIFHQSYTRNKKVEFPYDDIGYSYLPYQFNFNSMWAHVLTSATSGEGKPIRKDLTAGFIYHTELNGSWFDGALQVGINNQSRAWGHDQNNLVLSSTARRFPGVELKIQPAKWIRYSYVLGSLFSYANQNENYRKQIYGYDLGQVQKNFTYHLIELTPTNWLQISAGGGNIWSKRFELAYIAPFVMPHFTQIDVGDHDNTSMYFDIALLAPSFGKIWGGFFIDELSFVKSENLFKMPRNRYAWQVGWKSNLLSAIAPATISTIKYTRLTPFVYTHYPERDFNTFGSNRALDMTYTHDEFNLGFYLPPNSSELNWKITNMAVPDLTLSLDNRLIIHGTNDLSSQNTYQIYGDIYRHQIGEVLNYPLMNFTKDGIYDWTISSELKFDWKLRNSGLLSYYRLCGSLGYSNTQWHSNQSGVVAPESRKLFTGSIGIIVEM